MAISPSTLKHNSLEIYLKQWVNIASGGRVELRGGMTFPQIKGYLVFKCNTCQDNWHVGLENFSPSVTDPTGQTTVPSVLSDWVKKHRHICKQYKMGGDHSLCAECKWPYGAHEKQEFLAKETRQAERKLQLKQFTGRRFRDVEAPCESQDTSQKISHE